jgi:hypothetical protein
VIGGGYSFLPLPCLADGRPNSLAVGYPAVESSDAINAMCGRRRVKSKPSISTLMYLGKSNFSATSPLLHAGVLFVKATTKLHGAFLIHQRCRSLASTHAGPSRILHCICTSNRPDHGQMRMATSLDPNISLAMGESVQGRTVCH